jgi:cytochrome c-type biogenesis protein CcmF
MICCFVVLLGTIYPIIAQIFDESLSVGAPYFNKVFNPLALPLLVFASIVPSISWKNDKISRIKKAISLPNLVAVFIFGLVLFVPEKKSVIAAVSLSFSSMLIASMLKILYKNISNLKISIISMITAHIGLAILVIGLTITSIWGVEKEQLLQKNSVLNIDNYKIKYESVFIQSQDNYISKFAKFTLYDHHKKELTKLQPEVRFYPVEKNTTTESDIYYTLFSNIYVAIGDVTKNGAIVTRIYYKPAINLLWAGGFLMFIGGLLGLINRSKK